MSEELVDIGKVGRPHGVRGEVHIVPHNPGSELWHSGMTVTWRLPDRPEQELVLKTLRSTPKGLLAWITGFGDRDAVHKLVHGQLAIARSAMPAAEEGEYYLVDVIGAAVFDADSGERLGQVRNIGQTSVDVLEIVLDEGGEVLVPVTADYVTSIGEEPGRVLIRNLDHWRG